MEICGGVFWGLVIFTYFYIDACDGEGNGDS